ncbi:MAG: SprT family zinc-dependent metalloprotease [Patescibacteria group bacterium]|nr:SprT family zinc-dependent metalloprotease [Patescibacteria group bacterium]
MPTATKHQISYTVRSSVRTRRLRVIVQPGGAVLVTAPVATPMFVIEHFIADHAEWISRTVERMSRMAGHVFLSRDRRHYLRHREEARELAHRLLALHSPRLCFASKGIFPERAKRVEGVHIYKKVFIKDLRRNWGSCSERGNLNFNYKIALLPPRLAEYVVVHELCHLKEFNHSPRFWALVAQAIPDWRARRREMKKYHP